MTPETFTFLSGLIKQRSGIALTSDKTYLLESRLLPLARKRNIDSLDKLATEIRATHDEALLTEITEAMTTNESSFFRDQKPFDQFSKVLLPQCLARNAATRKIRIWSAASSSGQEAYSLAILCAEQSVKLAGWTIEIIGTDLSNEMVARARSGIYNQFEVQRGLPITQLIKYFKQVEGGWQINEQLRQMVQFRQGNLLQNFGLSGTFDIVFCRNVLIYFDIPTKAKILAAIRQIMAPGGVLILGGSETLLNITDQFKNMENTQGVYVSAAAAKPAVARQVSAS